MANSPENLEEVKQDIFDGQVIKDVNILFLDISSTCTGYAVMNIDFTHKTSQLASCGALWLNNKDWKDQQKYSYLFHAIAGYFWISQAIDYIVIEQYSINPKKMVGVQVLPEMIGVVKAAAEENGVRVASIFPQTWRAQLEIKPVLTKGVRDYKTPTKEKVRETYTIPEEIVSNLTGKARATPSDLFDAVAIGMGWSKKFGFKLLTANEPEINPHTPFLEKPE